MTLLDWIFPPKCMSCHGLLSPDDLRQNHWLCTDCTRLLIPLEPPYCVNCGRTMAEGVTICRSCRGKHFPFDHNRAVYAYDALVRDLMHAMKYRHKKQIAQGFGVLMANAFADGDIQKYDCLVPVPMYHKKQRRRGFNQAEVLAGALAARTGVPVVYGGLLRTRDTKPQSGLNARARENNVAGVFARDPKFDPRHKKIALIDDIYTTGATLAACAKVLADSGAESISCFTLSVTAKNMACADHTK